MNGMVTVNVSSNNTLKEGDCVRIWTAEASSGTPKLNPETVVVNAEQGLYWDDSQLSEGLLYVTTEVPTAIKQISGSDNVKAQIFTLNGRLVDTVEGNYDAIEETVRKAEPAQGIYIIRITDGKATETRKILIK